MTKLKAPPGVSTGVGITGNHYHRNADGIAEVGAADVAGLIKAGWCYPDEPEEAREPQPELVVEKPEPATEPVSEPELSKEPTDEDTEVGRA